MLLWDLVVAQINQNEMREVNSRRFDKAQKIIRVQRVSYNLSSLIREYFIIT
jgi:hypothetical protein